jgi:AMMECR1 domain-containing protein
MYNILLDIAKSSVQHGLVHAARLPVKPTDYPTPLHTPGIIFTCILQANIIVGCMGVTKELPLYLAASDSAYRAAFQDNRFPPLVESRLNKCSIQIYHLLNPKKYTNLSEKYFDSVISTNSSVLVGYENKYAYLLHSMQANYRDKKDFLNAVITKAGIPNSVPYTSMEITVFDTVCSNLEKFNE